jgi:hypothetical protein
MSLLGKRVKVANALQSEGVERYFAMIRTIERDFFETDLRFLNHIASVQLPEFR